MPWDRQIFDDEVCARLNDNAKTLVSFVDDCRVVTNFDIAFGVGWF